MNKKMIKKISNIVLNVLLYIFLAISIFSVFIAVFSKKDPDGAVDIFGRQMRIVISESMEECDLTDVSDYKIKDIPLHSMVFIKTVPEDSKKADEWYRSLRVGDVLTIRYVYETQKTITHRIVSIEEKETGGFIIELAGDNKNCEDGQLTQRIDTSLDNSPNYVIGKVTAKSHVFGEIVHFLKRPIGIIFAIMVPCVIIIIIEVIKITKIFSSDKESKKQAEAAEKESELEELRRRVAELEKEKQDQTVADDITDGSENKGDNRGGES